MVAPSPGNPLHLPEVHSVVCLVLVEVGERSMAHHIPCVLVGGGVLGLVGHHGRMAPLLASWMRCARRCRAAPATEPRLDGAPPPVGASPLVTLTSVLPAAPVATPPPRCR
jgi:hypothetical protein